jgi:hypothetical protein
MRAIVLWWCCLALAGCASQPDGAELVAPCPPAALPVCHAQAMGCGVGPFCYRTLGGVDCYGEPEPARRTIDAAAPPAACYVTPRRVGAESPLRAARHFASL